MRVLVWKSGFRGHSRGWVALALSMVVTMVALALSPPAAAAPAANDNFSNAVLFGSASGTTSGSNVDATSETGEPDHNAFSPGHSPNASVWWKWTPDVNGTATINTCGSGFDTVLAAYTGSAVNALSQVASSDNSSACGLDSLQSQISFSMTAGTEYHIVVDGFWTGTEGAITLNYSMPLGGGLPGATTLVSPYGVIVDSTPTYWWNAVANSTWYYLWVEAPPGSPVIKQWYTATEAHCSSGTGWCYAEPATAAPGNAEWWVQTWNSSGYGPWSPSLTFTAPTGQPPGAATLVSPSGTITDSTPTYTWNAVPTASHYYLWVNDATGTAIQTWYTATDAGCAGGTGSCSVNPATSVAGNGEWWILTWNASGYGPWSSSLTFRAPGDGPPGAATLVYPNGVLPDPTPTYTWNAVADSTFYRLWVNDGTGTPIVTWYSPASAGCASGTGTCSVTPSTAVSASATWWIQTWNTWGYGPWSAGMPFTVGSHIVTLEYGTPHNGPQLYGAALTVGVTYNIYADVTPTSDVAQVEFFLDGASVNTEVGDPYEMSLQTFTTAGSHTVTAVVTYTGGGTNTVTAPFTVVP